MTKAKNLCWYKKGNDTNSPLFRNLYPKLQLQSVVKLVVKNVRRYYAGWWTWNWADALFMRWWQNYACLQTNLGPAFFSLANMWGSTVSFASVVPWAISFSFRWKSTWIICDFSKIPDHILFQVFEHAQLHNVHTRNTADAYPGLVQLKPSSLEPGIMDVSAFWVGEGFWVSPFFLSRYKHPQFLTWLIQILHEHHQAPDWM